MSDDFARDMKNKLSEKQSQGIMYKQKRYFLLEIINLEL